VSDGNEEDFAPAFTNISKDPTQVKYVIKVCVDWENRWVSFFDNEASRSVAYKLPQRKLIMNMPSGIYAAVNLPPSSDAKFLG
jgi:hypothetical protein